MRTANKGWRIDYACVTDTLRDRIIDCRMLLDAVHADHCPVWLSISDKQTSQ
jgi:exodeoxyribonuclease-3